MTILTVYASGYTTDGALTGWTNPTYVYSNDGTNYATRAGSVKNTWYGNLYSFDLSSLPDDAVLSSVTLNAEWHNSADDTSGPVLLVGVWLNAAEYGSSSDTTGQLTPDEVFSYSPTGLTVANLKSTGANGFWAILRFRRTDNTAHTASVDYLNIVIDYSLPARTPNVTDTATATDTPTVFVAEEGGPRSVNKTETIGTSDSPSVWTNRLYLPISDSAGVTDIPAIVLTLAINVSDPVGVSDTPQCGVTVSATPTQNVTVIDIPSIALESFAKASDTITSLDIPNVLLDRLHVSGLDTVSTSDIPGPVLSLAITPTDLTSATDTAQCEISFCEISIVDTAIAADTQTLVLELVIEIADSITVLDISNVDSGGQTARETDATDTTSAADFLPFYFETVYAYDIPNVAFEVVEALEINVSDNVSSTDEVSVQNDTCVIDVVSLASVDDYISMTPDAKPIVSDTANASDTVGIVTGDIVLVALDATTVLDNGSLSHQLNIPVTDQASTIDSPNAVTSLEIGVTDSTLTEDAVTVYPIYRSANVSELVSVSESLTLSFESFVDRQDIAAAQDFPSLKTGDANVTVLEAINVVDTTSVLLDLKPSVQETVTTLDSSVLSSSDPIHIVDLTTATDSEALYLGLAISVSDDASVTDGSDTKCASCVISVSEIVDASDIPQMTSAPYISVADTVTATDIPQLYSDAINVESADTASIEDNVQLFTQSPLIVQDTVTAIDIPAVRYDISVATSDQIVAQDIVFVVENYEFVTRIDPTEATDLPIVTVELGVNVSSTGNVVDITGNGVITGNLPVTSCEYAFAFDDANVWAGNLSLDVADVATTVDTVTLSIAENYGVQVFEDAIATDVVSISSSIEIDVVSYASTLDLGEISNTEIYLVVQDATTASTLPSFFTIQETTEIIDIDLPVAVSFSLDLEAHRSLDIDLVPENLSDIELSCTCSLDCTLGIVREVDITFER